MLVALGNPCSSQQRLTLLLQAAIAAAHPPFLAGKFPSSATADGTNFGRNLHQGTLFPLCTAMRHCASAQAGSSVQILWRSGCGCGEVSVIESLRHRIIESLKHPRASASGPMNRDSMIQ